MNLIRIYQCFCDETRLRIINLLKETPLCVCHFQTLINEPQVKISKHLSYLKSKGLVEATRHQNWMIYRLPITPSAELELNLKCLQDCRQTESQFRADLEKLSKLRAKLGWLEELCCTPAQRSSRPKNASGSARSAVRHAAIKKAAVR